MIAQGIEKSADDIRQNQFEVAMHRLDELIDSNPYSVDLLLNKSTISYASNDFDEAVKLLKKAREIDPFDYRVYYNMFVVQWKQQKYSSACTNFKKCLSLLHTLATINTPTQNPQQNLQRSLQLWSANTAAYITKSITLITQNNLIQASEVTKTALEHCILKHHIYALCCIIDSKLNRKVDRDRNARDYHAELLRPVVVVDRTQGNADEGEGKQEEGKKEIEGLIGEFNQMSRKCDVGKFRRCQTVPNLTFMSVTKPTSINIEYEISKNLGVFDLACIKQDQQSQALQNQPTQLKTESKSNQNPNPIPQSQPQPKQQPKYQIKQLQLQLNNSKQDNKDSFDKYKEDNSRNLQQEAAGNQLVLQEQRQRDRELGESGSLEENMFKQEKTFQLGDLNSFPNWMKTQPTVLEQNQQKQPKSKSKQAEVPEKVQKKAEQSQLLYPITHPKFQVKLISADLQINQELQGKMNPYVYYQYGSQKHKSTIAKGQGLKPRWENQIKIFILQRNPTKMRVSVYEREVFKWDDLVGQTSFDVLRTGIYEMPIYLKGRKSGEVVFYISKVS